MLLQTEVREMYGLYYHADLVLVRCRLRDAEGYCISALTILSMLSARLFSSAHSRVSRSQLEFIHSTRINAPGPVVYWLERLG